MSSRRSLLSKICGSNLTAQPALEHQYRRFHRFPDCGEHLALAFSLNPPRRPAAVRGENAKEGIRGKLRNWLPQI